MSQKSDNKHIIIIDQKHRWRQFAKEALKVRHGLVTRQKGLSEQKSKMTRSKNR